jgi:excisionase family DNA binding protein
VQRIQREVNKVQAIETLGVIEASKKIGVGQRTIRTAIDRGELRAIKLGERRIRPESLEVWLRSLETGGDQK